jgi:hypothetical protein
VKLPDASDKNYDLRLVTLDGEKAWKLRCPSCGDEKYLDDDQFHGRVSVLCDCGFHETVNFSHLQQARGQVERAEIKKPPNRGWGKDLDPETKRDRLEQLSPSAQPEVDVHE